MQACLTLLAALAWLLSAAFWLRAARHPLPLLPPLTADADRDWGARHDEALRGAAQRNTYAAVAAMVAAALQCLALVVG